MHGKFAEQIVEDLAADIVPQDIDAAGGMLLHLRADATGLVVDRRIEPEFVDEPLALVQSASDSDDAAAGNLADLADDGTCCARSSR